MIGIKLHGRLGNQLFQYAFAVQAAKQLRTSFYIDDNKQNPVIRKYFKLRLFEKRRNDFIKKRATLKKEINERDFSSSYDLLHHLENNVGYYGFFQSENYLKKHKSSILEKFQIKKKFIWPFKEKYGELFNTHKTIAIHLRRTDYASDFFQFIGEKDISLPLEYYKNFLRSIQDIEKYKVIFVSDDIEYAIRNFTPQSNYLFEQNSEIVDFQLIMNADIICTANSSFSWWAAFLNQKKSKIIYCPEYWMGHKLKTLHPKEIIPENWNIVKFN
jgi:hypothetical protein